MRIIVLIGEDQSGKTTILKKIVTRLIACGAIMNISKDITRLQNLDRDVEICLTLKRKKIVVCTMGDDYSYYKQKIHDYKGVDLLILSQHPNHYVISRDTIPFDNMASFILKETNTSKKTKKISDYKHLDYLLRIIQVII